MSVKLYLWGASPPLASHRLQSLGRLPFFLLLTALLGMGYYILQRQRPATGAPLSENAHWRKQLETGTPYERRAALLALISAGAEDQLAQCLASNDPTVTQLAITGLWECWQDEEGTEARRTMDQGVEAMNKGDLAAATGIFTRLMDEHPQWAEAINKQATILYLQARPEESIALCHRVVALKPNHFGAWNGMAICAIQTENWSLALEAVRQSLRLQPHSSMNRQLLRLVESRIPTV